MPLLVDSDIRTGFIRERTIITKLLRPLIPKMARKYAMQISKVTGLPLETVMKSKPFRNYLNALTE